ncbi:proton-conducting transporter membrane subunit [Streptomyces sp. SLBN-31]|uniref:proton-conducting transporter transmembrane domain-containing protein n=1 Tax=Streptomyces sp. SLBN-31 TaxID=2768444 RepID=UPI0011699F92|nr:proton-conducting transporter membrane subunit [Streptomyces sp. SLBN-31]TQJ75730.1 proton-conducting membrane transporter [Streptomyces sp. SLBN-31]
MGNDALLLIGGAMILMGLLFKVGAVPFHMWRRTSTRARRPRSPGSLAAATKVAGRSVALLRLLYVVLPGMRWDWRPVMWAVAIVTCRAVRCRDHPDRHQAAAGYSSIAHAGFILAGVIATSKDGVSSVLFYLGAYSFVTIGAFAVVTLVRDAGGEATHLSKWAGLGRRSPLVARAVFAVFLLAFAGIPLTSGFAGSSPCSRRRRRAGRRRWS